MIKQLSSALIRNRRHPAGLANLIRHAEDGVSAVEFALVTPLLLCLVLGILVYGVYFFTWIAVTHAASEGARASVAGLSTQERINLATAQVNNLFSAYAPILSSANATIAAQQSPTNGGLFQVSITYDFSQFAFGVLGSLLPVPNATPTVTVTVSNGGY
jgi:Flp pilus assembly protein TadG